MSAEVSTTTRALSRRKTIGTVAHDLLSVSPVAERSLGASPCDVRELLAAVLARDGSAQAFQAFPNGDRHRRRDALARLRGECANQPVSPVIFDV